MGGELVSTSYRNLDGINMAVTAERIAPADGSNTTFIGDQWYVVDKDLALEGRLEIYGSDVNIILGDGATLTAHGGIYVRDKTPSGDNCKLTIWSQLRGTGTLNAGATWTSDADTLTDELRAGKKAGREGAGIGSGWLLPSKAITINGGTVTAAGYNGGAGIGGGNNEDGQGGRNWYACDGIYITGGTVKAYAYIEFQKCGLGRCASSSQSLNHSARFSSCGRMAHLHRRRKAWYKTVGGVRTAIKCRGLIPRRFLYGVLKN